MSETTFNQGNSYGPEAAVVQFAVAPTAGACGTIFRGARRISKIDFAHLGGVSVDLKIQENDDLSDSGWSDVGSPLTLVPLGEGSIDARDISKPYARIYGGPTSASGSAQVRASIVDLEMLSDFRQDSPYGVG